MLSCGILLVGTIAKTLDSGGRWCRWTGVAEVSADCLMLTAPIVGDLTHASRISRRCLPARFSEWLRIFRANEPFGTRLDGALLGILPAIRAFAMCPARARVLSWRLSICRPHPTPDDDTPSDLWSRGSGRLCQVLRCRGSRACAA